MSNQESASPTIPVTAQVLKPESTEEGSAFVPWGTGRISAGGPSGRYGSLRGATPLPSTGYVLPEVTLKALG